MADDKQQLLGWLLIVCGLNVLMMTVYVLMNPTNQQALVGLLFSLLVGLAVFVFVKLRSRGAKN